MRKPKGMKTSGVKKRGGFETGERTEVMACVKTGNTMVTKKQNQIEKEWYFNLDKSLQREMDLREFGAAVVSGDASRSWVSASVSILVTVKVR